MQKFLIAGLGNIGAEYDGTRHNIGFDVADAFAAKHSATYSSDRLAQVAQFTWKGKHITLIKPTTFMNLSGKAVKYWLDKEHVPVEHLLVIADDLALPIDRMRLRPSGSAAGHNGLISIQESLGTDRYARLRFGIGNDYAKGGQVDFVLGKWTEADRPIIAHKIEKSVAIIESFLLQGLARTMNDWNKIEFRL